MTQFTVTNLEDTGAGSLRQAIEDANALSGKDEIVFEDSLSGGTITLASGQIEITDSLTVRGLGADSLTLKGNTETRDFFNRIFSVSDGFENQDTFFDVELIGLTLTEGSSFGFRETGQGGAIDNDENLTIIDSVITDNSAPTGGGIENRGTLIVRNSAIVNNTATGGFAPLDGGGIKNSGTAFIENTTIANNSANTTGGGIFNDDDAVLEVFNSTITGNTTGTSTIYDGGEYQAEETQRRNSRSGAGIYNRYDTRPPSLQRGTVTITSSIVADNANNSDLGGGVFDDVAPPAPFNSGGNNLIGIGDTVDGFTDGINGDIVGTTDTPIDPRLSTLQNNGGSTPTQALLSNSPAIDAGSNPNNLEFDRRGEGFDRVVNGSADIGAFEIQNAANLVSILATTPTAVEGGEDGIFTISRSGDTSNELIINLTLANSSTASTDDYSFSGGNVRVTGDRLSVIIPPGQSSVGLAVSATDDTLAEEAETIAIDLAGGSGYGIDGSNSAATVEIARSDFDTGTVVTNTNDAGAGSLRQAIIIANSVAGTDTITFDPSLVGETITLTSGELDVTDSVDIEGLGASQIAISGNNNSRVFNIDDDNNTFSDLEIIDSTISGNTAATNGGGIYNTDYSNLTILQSTIAGNSANSGGGVFNFGDGFDVGPGDTSISNSTITNNSAETGSGITNNRNPIEVTSTIIAGNKGDRDLAGIASFASNGHNLIGNGDGASGFTNNENNDIVGTSGNAIDPLLDTLQDNGGATPTVAILTESPAIDAGSNPLNLTTDQRGEGFDRILGNATDIGAFESEY